MRKQILKGVVNVFLMLIGLVSLNAQILLKEISLQKQIENSTLVVEGKVLSKVSFWDASGGNIYTANTIQVYKVFKGGLFETIEVITKGGVVGLSAEIVSPSLSLSEGDMGVFMLYDNNVFSSNYSKSSKIHFKPFGSLQGFYMYNLYTDEAVNPFNKKKGIKTSFYNEIMSHTKSDYKEISSFDNANKQFNSSKIALVIPGAISFTPTTVTGGTKMVLTINGTGFGSAKAKVFFSKSDDGGATFVQALDTQVLTWTDTQITVEVPSGAGTGPIRVTDSFNGSATSTSNLVVSYSESNVQHDSDDAGPLPTYAYKIQHTNVTEFVSGYTWRMFSGFNANTNAKAAFLRAFDSWRCETGINWLIGATTEANETKRNDGNIIRFDVGNELDSGVLAQCISYYSGCVSGNTFNWYVSELDIVFDDGINWNYSSATNSTQIGQYDFESVTLHELGHGHQLSHVIDTNDVMHYAITTSEEQRVLGTNNINGANDVQSRSTTIVPCSGNSIMSNHPCALSIDEEELKAAINIYPNPTRGELNIKNNSLLNLEKVVIYDIRGRLISENVMTNSSRVKTINLFNVSKGMYFVNIYSDKAMITKKIILE